MYVWRVVPQDYLNQPPQSLPELYLANSVQELAIELNKKGINLMTAIECVGRVVGGVPK